MKPQNNTFSLKEDHIHLLGGCDFSNPTNIPVMNFIALRDVMTKLSKKSLSQQVSSYHTIHKIHPYSIRI